MYHTIETGTKISAGTGGCRPVDEASGAENRRKRRLIVTGVLIFLLTCGMAVDEGDFLGGKHASAGQYLMVYSAFLPLLIYIVPFCVFMKWASAKYRVRGLELLAAAFCGTFFPAAFAGDLNSGFEDLMKSLMGHAYSSAWLGSAETGIVEEVLKLAATAMLLYVLNRKSLSSYLCIGMCVGMGFQVEEDISYITDSGFQNVSQAFPTALDRVYYGSLGSHWAYAAVTAIGLYLIVRTRGVHHVRRGVGWILFVMADHFLYDTPLGDSLLISAILTVGVVLPVAAVFTSAEMRGETVSSGADTCGQRGIL
ncbi:MAG: PrsW family glutamic-type intramembrane protease [Eubacterium sp.]